MQRVVSVLSVANTQNCSITLWAMEKLGMVSQTQAAESIVNRFVELHQTANIQECANLLYAAGKLGVSDQHTCSLVLERALKLEPSWSLREVS